MSILPKSLELKKRGWNQEGMHEIERLYMMAIHEHGSHLRFLCHQVLKHGSDKTKILQSVQTYVADTSPFLKDSDG